MKITLKMKHEILFSCSLFPEGIIPAECSGISRRCLISTGTFVSKGDNIVLFTIYRWKEGQKYLKSEPAGSYLLTSDYDGYVYNPGGDDTWGTKEGGELLTIYSSLDELIDSNFDTSYSLEEDSFSLEKYIWWYRVAGKGFVTKQKNGFWIDNCMLSLSVKDRQPVLQILYDRKKAAIFKKDTVTFKFDDDTYLSFPITSAPGKIEHSRFSNYFTIPLFNNDITTFANKGWSLFKIEHSNGDAPHILKNGYRQDYCPPFSSMLFKIYTNKYAQALEELNIVPIEGVKPASNEEFSTVPNVEEECYVYLMIDTTNGFHKIGISNHPEYRERTLQSEKPTIEKICAKRFPSRQIATAIESALHATFASKRVRGEWFNLSPTDVAQVIETLR